MNLSQHFLLEEFIASDVASKRGIDNHPSQEVIANLKKVSAVMEQVRSLLQQPIYITSGYRSSALNKIVGSKPSSKHVQGLACDFKVPGYGTPKDVCEAIAASDIKYDQLILEYNGWVHIGLAAKCRNQVLTINEYGIHAGIRT